MNRKLVTAAVVIGAVFLAVTSAHFASAKSSSAATVAAQPDAMFIPSSFDIETKPL